VSYFNQFSQFSPKLLIQKNVLDKNKIVLRGFSRGEGAYFGHVICFFRWKTLKKSFALF